MTIDTCASVVNIDSPDPRNCRLVDPFETTFRGSASYTIPKVNVLISAALRSQPAVQLLGTTNPVNTGAAPSGATPSGANLNVPNPVVRDLLGRLPPGGLATGTTVVALLDNTDRVYADTRRNQIDMRFAKVFRFGARRFDVGVDLQNLLNTNYATAYETRTLATAPERRDVEQPDHDSRAPVHAVELHAELLTHTRARQKGPSLAWGGPF